MCQKWVLGDFCGNLFKEYFDLLPMPTPTTTITSKSGFGIKKLKKGKKTIPGWKIGANSQLERLSRTPKVIPKYLCGTFSCKHEP